MKTHKLSDMIKGWCIGDFIWKEGTRDWQIIVSDKNVNFDYDENKSGSLCPPCCCLSNFYSCFVVF